MNETEDPASQKIRYANSSGFFQTAVERFRTGEDAAGIESLLNAAEKLESEVEADRSSRWPQIDLSKLLPALRRLHNVIKNQDITGICDLLEDTLLPLTSEWLKGSDGT